MAEGLEEALGGSAVACAILVMLTIEQIPGAMRGLLMGLQALVEAVSDCLHYLDVEPA